MVLQSRALNRVKLMTANALRHYALSNCFLNTELTSLPIVFVSDDVVGIHKGALSDEQDMTSSAELCMTRNNEVAEKRFLKNGSPGS